MFSLVTTSIDMQPRKPGRIYSGDHVIKSTYKSTINFNNTKLKRVDIMLIKIKYNTGA